MSAGIDLGEFHTLPEKVQRVPEPALPSRPVQVRNYHPTNWLDIVLREEKKHQIRRLTAAVSYSILRFLRIAIKSQILTGLKVGEWCYLTSDEVKLLIT